MPAATVLIPTHSHPEPLRVAAESVLGQTLADFELLIVGDGVGDDTRAIADELVARDSRVRFLDFPKAPRKGETLRHKALEQAAGRFVAYLGDDDVWMPIHLETLDAALAEAHFAHTLHIGVTADNRLWPRPTDIADDHTRNKMLTKHFNSFDMTFAGHTLDAYRRLPSGWETTPPDFPWIDLYMWRKFLAEPWLRAASVMVPTAICTQSSLRPDMTSSERAAETAGYLAAFARPGYREELWRIVAAFMTRQIMKERERKRQAEKGELKQKTKVAKEKDAKNPNPAKRKPAAAVPLAAAASGAPALTIVVVFYNMRREAERTLHTLSPSFQRGVTAADYRVIAVDNASTEPLDPAWVEGFGPNFRLLRLDDGTASPAPAVNAGVAAAETEHVAIVVDGARMVSPGMVGESLRALRAFDDAVVGALPLHIGKDAATRWKQPFDQAAEDEWLAGFDWQADGYKLFEAAVMAKPEKLGFLCGLPTELSWLAMPKAGFDRLGGYDEAFASPGGGFVNQDFLKRAVESGAFEFVMLLGEGTFHQFHGGATSGAAGKVLLDDYDAEYRRIRGAPYRRFKQPLVHQFGTMRPAAWRFLMTEPPEDGPF